MRDRILFALATAVTSATGVWFICYTLLSVTGCVGHWVDGSLNGIDCWDWQAIGVKGGLTIAAPIFVLAFVLTLILGDDC